MMYLTSTPSSDMYVISNMPSPGGGEAGFAISFLDDNLYFIVGYISYAWDEVFMPKAQIPVHQWVHITGVRTATELKLYLNGVEQNTSVVSSSSINNPSSQPIRIGARSGGSDYFNGLLDETRISSLALEPASFLQLPNQSTYITWTGETGYENDGIDPNTDWPLSNFAYRIKYQDVDGDAPMTGYPKVHIMTNGTEITGSPFEMTEADSDPYTTGRIYTYSNNTLESGNSYTYQFEAQDSEGNNAVGDGTIEQNDPVVTDQQYVTFLDITGTSGTDGGNPYGEGAAFIDYNADDLVDIYVSTTTGADYLFENTGNNVFTDVRSAAGIDDNFRGTVTYADIDNDRDLDILLGNNNSALYENNGDNTFSDITAQAGLPTNAQWGTLADINNDGYVDIAYGNYLFENNGNNTFTDVSATSGIVFNNRPMIFTDIDLDGDLDVSFGEGDIYKLYENDGSGIFTEITSSSGLPSQIIPEIYMSNTWGDINNDGYPDVYMSLIGSNRLYRNDGNNQFTDISETCGAVNTGLDEGSESGSRYSSLADVNNDGYLDIYVSNFEQANTLFINKGNESFIEITSSADVGDTHAGHGAIFGDIENDGNLDLYVANSEASNVLYQNEGNSYNWIEIRLIGHISNAAAIGAKIKVVAGSLTMYREVSGGFGAGSQNDIRQHFGLGQETLINSIEIKWPSGVEQIFQDQTINQIITIEEYTETFSTTTSLGDPPSTTFGETGVTMDFSESPGGEVTVDFFNSYPLYTDTLTIYSRILAIMYLLTFDQLLELMTTLGVL